MTSRRHFIRTSAMAGALLSDGLRSAKSFAWNVADTGNLHELSNHLLKQWAEAILRLQVTDKTSTKYYGGIFCAADNAVHGRCGDTIYPFLHLADKHKDHRYLDAATLLYRWMETHVSQTDGSWLNEPVAGSWKGTTVFASIALAEAIKHHGAILEASLKNEMLARLNKAGDFIYTNMNFQYGNINYPISAAYGLSLLGEVLDNSKFKERGKQLAHESLNYFTKKDKLIYGEGDMGYEPSPKGCLAIDLGYNVEESLPALVQYGLLNRDEEVLSAVTQSMQQHLEFMLPDGAWDNSWGTRNYKWTYWGSRTSDGCQTAYALLANRDPRFYKAALLNTQLLQQCTHEGLLTGGPHYHAHGVPTCSHHTFSHMKALTTVLNHPATNPNLSNMLLPREKNYDIRFFEDIQTWLISKGKFRATITGYDKEYKKTKNGHATGGALTMLWHEKAGPILCGSMNEYQLFEAGNMQKDTDPLSMPLTPRIELKENGKTYMNISDLSAKVSVSEEKDRIVVIAESKLVDKDQKSPVGGEVRCVVKYEFREEKVVLVFECDREKDVNIVLPVVSKEDEKIVSLSDKRVQLNKNGCIVNITSDQMLQSQYSQRVFNYVPGLETLPVRINKSKVSISIQAN